MKIIYTIGHSSRAAEDFLAMLRARKIGQVIDVRTVPRSRYNPQFNKDNLAKFLRNRRIVYRHAKNLGGLRHARKDSKNLGWKNLSFRGYADYMQTDEFWSALEGLMKLAKQKKTAIMCAEAVPWRCHRSLIADALSMKKWEVRHIMSKTFVRPHEMTSFAKRKGGKLVYPPFEP